MSSPRPAAPDAGLAGAASPAPPTAAPTKKTLKVAVTGCVHGEIEKVYKTIAEIEKRDGIKVDLVVCAGDFQSVRNHGDLHHMHVKPNFRSLQSFYKYYSGEETAPILTLFVGGNHEASGFLLELPNGGWVAPNVYYMGFASVVKFAGLRIAGLSGIYKAQDYQKGHYERPPFARGSEISAYHVRALEVFRLRQLRARDGEAAKNCIDCVVTHDWPAGITDYGNVQQLLRFKPYFEEDIKYNRLGNAATLQLLQELRPKHWFAAHLHCKFPALIPHELDGVEPTKFLALDKPIPRRHFLQILDIEVDADAPLTLEHDADWLAILRSTDKFTEVTAQACYLPSKVSNERWDFRPTDEELAAVRELGDLSVSSTFLHTAPPLKHQDVQIRKNDGPSQYYRNPQSEKFCKWLGIRNLNALLAEDQGADVGTAFYLTDVSNQSGEISLSSQEEEEFGDLGFVVDGAGALPGAATSTGSSNTTKLPPVAAGEPIMHEGNEAFGASEEWTAPVGAGDLDDLLAGFSAPGDGPASKRSKF
ncbi:unnamed protein product, partial [Mesorhabditis spiculigera]